MLKQKSELISPRRAAAILMVNVVGWSAVMTPGCAKEHRISLAEFMVIEDAAARAAQPTTESEKRPMELSKFIGPYRIGPGDVLTITINGAEGVALFPPVRARVDRHGKVDLPVIGALALRDRELEDAEDTVCQAYVPNVYKEATCLLELSTTESTKVLVFGAVTAPGLVPLRYTERNLLFALVGAGGVTEAAAGKATLRRIRHPDQQVTLELTDPVQLAAALALPPLEEGDIVHVHAATPNTVYVGGLVNRAAPQIYPSGTRVTVLQALAGATGLRTDVFPKEGTLIRRMPNGQDVHVKLDLNRIGTGRDPNILLAAGDVLWVPDTWETRVQDWVNRNIFLRAGATVTYSVTGIEFMNRRSLQASGVGGGDSTLQDSFDPFGFLVPTSSAAGGGGP